MNPSCKECRYFAFDDGDVGACRRYPPSIYDADADESYWPMLSVGDWCGEFVRKDGLPQGKCVAHSSTKNRGGLVNQT